MNLIEFLETDTERRRRPIGRSIDDPSVSELVKKAVSIAYEYAGENMDTEEMIDAFQELFSAPPQDASTTDELKPCPFCGGKAEFRSGSSTTPYIRCRECGGRTKSSYNEANLIAVWNRRVCNHG